VLIAGMVFGAAARAIAQDAAPPVLQLTLPSSQEPWRDSITSAAGQAAAIAYEWLGPHPSAVISTIAIDPPVWQGRGAMMIERQAAQAVIRSWWPTDLADRQADAMLDGFAWYLQGQVIERLFDLRYLRTAHSVAVVPVFGGAAYWSVPTLRLSRWSAGILRHDRSVAARYAAMFATLERWSGAPALQAAMFEVAQLPAGRLSAGEIGQTISAATGLELSWLFTIAGDPAATVDYAVTGMRSADATSCAPPCFETVVTVAHAGSAQFTGTSRAPVGEFDGGAIELRVAFENAAHAAAQWDGRAESKTFRFVGPSRAIGAELDPERLVVLDENYLNNAIVEPRRTNAPVRKWMARWLVWAQNALMSYGFFA
jgi:hypothetical protein